MASNTEELLKDVTPELIDKWESKLLKECSQYTKLTEMDKNIDDYNLTYSQIKTIKNDVDRTRIRERVGVPEFAEILEKLLVYYCKLNSIEYKQGMNEIMGPIILLKTKFEMSIPRILNLFSLFVDKFLTNYYHEPELYAFRSSVALLTLLLKYHDPELFLLFEKSGVSPQMYATNWLLTTHANKHSLNIVYKFWDILIDEGDQLLIHYVVIAFLQYFRKEFLTNDFSMIPLIFSKIKIDTYEVLLEIVKNAKEIREKTPYSFRILVNKLEIFKARSVRLRELNERYDVENMLAFPILPSEILFNFYLAETNCVDNHCKYFLTNNNNENELECYYCKDKIKLFRKNFFVIDIRNFDKRGGKNNEGNLEGVVPFFSKRNEKVIDKSLLASIIDEIHNRHIILLTSDTSYFGEYEEKFFKEIKTAKIKQFLPNYIHKSEKLLDQDEVNLEKKKDKSKNLEAKLEEYQTIKDFLSLLVENKIRFVSYSLGGFKSIHELCLKYNLSILNHKENLCEYCKKEKNKNEQIECYSKLFNKVAGDNSSFEQKIRSRSMNGPKAPQNETNENSGNDCYLVAKAEIEAEQMSRYIADKNNKIFHCLLIEHNMYKYNEKIMLIIFFDCVKIFKMKIKEKKMCFDIIDIIQFEEFKSIKPDNTIFEVYYVHNTPTQVRHDLKLDFFTDADATNFKENALKIIEH